MGHSAHDDASGAIIGRTLATAERSFNLASKQG